MSTKAGLKAAKAAIDAQDWEKAVTEAGSVLDSDSNNYFARLFLGRAQEKQGHLDNAAKTYLAAANSKPEDYQAWLGLCSLYELQGGKKVDEYREAVVKAAEIFAAGDDAPRCQTTVDKFVGFARKNGSPQQIKRALQIMLPGTPIYDCLEGRIPPPSLTYLRLAELTEEVEDQRIKQEINNRRTRIGARLGQVTLAVKREVFNESDLEKLYQEVINWSSDDEIRRQYEEKLLQRAYDTLTVLPVESKDIKLDQVLTLAEGMVIIKHSFQLAWDLVLETRDLEELRDLDVGILREYMILFPESGLGKILEGWLSSELSPFPPPPKPQDLEEEQSQPKEYSQEEILLLMTEGISKVSSSALAHRLVSEYYLHLEEYEDSAETARAGITTLQSQRLKVGMSLHNTKDALSSVLGTSLVHYQAPKHHAEAKELFQDILARKPKSTPALIGLGLIFEETENYSEAISFLTRALTEDQGNLIVGTELAWCRALHGDYSVALSELEAYLPNLKVDEPRARDLRAKVLYRIGICVWNIDITKAARRDRSGAYSYFLQAIKTNVNFASAYTSLGIYYAQYGKDRKRARQCFQKAFELSPSETFAAEQLAKFFADQGDWDIVEVVAQRVIESGRARPPPGSKRKGISWPYSALGIVQMNKQEYQKAIVSFLAALRIDPEDYQSYVGLGESYHNSGRYNSALRTFQYAIEPPTGARLNVTGETWFARYMLANVHRELGEYDEAIAGLRDVLCERPNEFGVLMSLLQAYGEKAWRCLDTGLFGQAIESASEAIATAKIIVIDHPSAFNMWKGVGDACMVYAFIQSGVSSFPKEDVRILLDTAVEPTTYTQLQDVDRIELSTFSTAKSDGHAHDAMTAGILAMKRAIFAATNDKHAQAVAWYNLGWAEHHSHLRRGSVPGGRRFLKAAVHCFKHAIELEAGNAEFWNAMGVVTTTLNPKVAQHSFVRSLNLNEMNAKVWTNLGVLYLLQNEYDLAHQAFGRSQSTDPEYAHAWVGEGLLSLLTGEQKLALNHFTHAFEIADSSSIITKRQYALSSFDHLLISSSSVSNDLAALIQPIFALEQLRAQTPRDSSYRHLSGLLLERVGNHAAATELLTSLCSSLEAEYETTESEAALGKFSQAKADLARNELAIGEFSVAFDDAETAIDLSSDAEHCGLDAEALRKLRLSAHLTAGLAAFRLERGPESIQMFRNALEESQSDPDVICALVQILWTHGGADQRSIAREQLFSAVEQHPGHISSITLLGAIAALDDDSETLSAIKDDLESLRTTDDLKRADADAIETLLSSLTALRSDNVVAEMQSAILLRPNQSVAWMELAEHTGDSYAAQMALVAARKLVPPMGDMGPEGLAKAIAGVGSIADAQCAIMLAPGESGGWCSLTEAISAT